MDGESERPLAWDAMPSALLVVAAPRGLVGGLDDVLRRAGYLLRFAEDAAAAKASMAACAPDLLIIDGRTRAGSAGALCHRLAMDAPCPTLVVDRGGDVIDRILALELGADGHLAEPVNEREMLAQVKALLRRGQSRARQSRPVEPPTGQPWRLNLMTRSLLGPGKTRPVMLTPREQALLSAFLNRPGELLTFQDALRTVGAQTADAGQLKTIVMRLRRKMEIAGFAGLTIRSLRSAGYVFDHETAARAIVAA